MRFLLLLGLIDFSFCGVLNYYNIIEGDILERKTIPDTENSELEVPDFRWPNATVPYRISHEYTNSEKQKIHEAMEEIHQKTCVRFREARDSDYNLIGIVKEGACASFVGRQGSVQDVSLDGSCLDKNKILHVLMHVLGFVHEHNRADRDEYVDIYRNNIKEGQKHNFKKRKFEDLTLMDTPYSYNSIMHYRSDVFAKYKDFPTIVPKTQVHNMGGGERLSDIDVKRIRKLYCSKKRRSPPPTIIEGFNFQRGNGEIMWSNHCDFYGNDIDQKQMEANDCKNYCARNSKCSHFTWNPYNDGVCYLKAGFTPDAKPRSTEDSFVCGFRGPPKSESSGKQEGQGVW